MWTSQLKVLTTKVTMLGGPNAHIDLRTMAMKLHTVLAVALTAAPVLFLR